MELCGKIICNILTNNNKHTRFKEISQSLIVLEGLLLKYA